MIETHESSSWPIHLHRHHFFLVAILLACMLRVVSAAQEGPSVQPRPVPRSQESQPESWGVETEYARLLATVVSPEGLVRYDLLLVQNSDAMRMLLQSRADHYRTSLPTDPHERLAFYLNTYNLSVMYMAALESQRPQFTTVKDAPGFFDGRAIGCAGAKMTLYDLEGRLRAMGDPRIHAAMVRGARGSPALRSEPYRGDRLDQQLDDQCRRWLADPAHVSVVDEHLNLSALFKWYADDFKTEPYHGIIGFIRAKADPQSQVHRLAAMGPDPASVIYKPFDWQLNRAPLPAESQPSASQPGKAAAP